MRCNPCGRQTDVLFYPRHQTSKKPNKNSYRCCMICVKNQPMDSQYAQRRELDKAWEKERYWR